eukprot:10389674-Alexandrium_andersonii.AAC.1
MELINLQPVAPEVAGLLYHPIGCRPAPRAPGHTWLTSPPWKLSFEACCAAVRAKSCGDGEKCSWWWNIF